MPKTKLLLPYRSFLQTRQSYLRMTIGITALRGEKVSYIPFFFWGRWKIDFNLRIVAGVEKLRLWVQPEAEI